MISLLLCGLQVTIVLITALWLSRKTLQRDPTLSAILGFAGMVAAAALVVLFAMDIPRPFSVQEIVTSNSVTGPVSIAHEPTADNNQNEPIDQQASRGIGLSWYSVTDTLREFAISQSARRVEQMHGAFWCVVAALVVAFVCRIILGTYAVIVVRRRSRIYESDAAAEWILSWKSAIGLNIPIEIRVSPSIPSPCVTWLRRGEIMVPESFVSWSVSDQQATLAHEVQHIARRDALLRFAVDLFHLVICFHPLAYGLRRQIVLAQEVATDRGAMVLLGDQSSYRVGLASLALRIDALASSNQLVFGVSVSTNDLIRRIKMLSSVSSPLRKWQKVSAVVALVAIASSVSLFSTAEDAPRIASLARGGETKSNLYFQRPPSQPWENVGPSDNYLRVLPTSLRALPDYENALDMVASELLNDDTLLPKGFLGNNWLLFESNLFMKTRKINPPTESGHQWMLMQSVDSLRMEFRQPVDWTVVSESLDWAKFGPVDSEISVRMSADMSALGKSNVLDLTRKTAQDSPVNAALSKQIWKRIDGGAVGAVWRVDESFTNQEAAEADKSGLIGLLQRCEAIGLGLDFDAEVTTAHARIVLVPQNDKSIDELQACLSALKKKLSEAPVADADNSGQSEGFLRQAKVTIEKLADDGPDVLVLTGQGDPLVFALF